MEENLGWLGLSKVDVMARLKEQGVDNIHEVLYAGMDATGTVYVSTIERGTEAPGKYGID